MNFTPATYQVSFVQGPATRTRPLCPYPQQARFTGSVSVIGGVPIATNHADLTSDKVSMHRGEAVGAGGAAEREQAGGRLLAVVPKVFGAEHALVK